MGQQRGRPEGQKTREGWDTEKALRKWEELCRPEQCCKCNRVPVRGHVVLPDFSKWVRKGTATRAGLEVMIAKTGWLCRSCLVKRTGGGRPKAKDYFLVGMDQEEHDRLAVEGEAIWKAEQQAEREQGRKRALDVRMEELGLILRG